MTYQFQDMHNIAYKEVVAQSGFVDSKQHIQMRDTPLNLIGQFGTIFARVMRSSIYAILSMVH